MTTNIAHTPSGGNDNPHARSFPKVVELRIPQSFDTAVREFVEETGMPVRIDRVPTGIRITCPADLAPLVRLLIDSERRGDQEYQFHIRAADRAVEATVSRWMHIAKLYAAQRPH